MKHKKKGSVPFKQGKKVSPRRKSSNPAFLFGGVIVAGALALVYMSQVGATGMIAGMFSQNNNLAAAAVVPSTPTATYDATSQSITVRWSYFSGASNVKFKLTRACGTTTFGSSFVDNLPSSAGQTSYTYTDNGLGGCKFKDNGGKVIQYKVAAYVPGSPNQFNPSAASVTLPSDIATAVKIVKPGNITNPPTIINLADGKKGVRISWNDDSRGEHGYRIHRRTLAQGQQNPDVWSLCCFADVAGNNDGRTTTEDKTGALIPGETYQYMILTVGPSAGLEARSDTIQIRIPGTPSPEPLGPTPPPEILSVVKIAASKNVRINFKDNSNNESRFEIYRSTETGGGGYAKVGTVNADGPNGANGIPNGPNADTETFVDNTTAACTTYYYQVLAVRAQDSAASGQSNTSTVTTTSLNGGTCAPAGTPASLSQSKPTNVKAEYQINGSIKVTWDYTAPQGVTNIRYKILRACKSSPTVNDHKKFVEGIFSTRTATDIGSKGLASFDDPAPICGINPQNLNNISYQVIAYNANGNSNRSDPAKVSNITEALGYITVLPPFIRLDLASTTGNQSILKLSWNDSSTKEIAYQVSRKVNNGNYVLIRTINTRLSTYEYYDTVANGNTYTYIVTIVGNPPSTNFSRSEAKEIVIPATGGSTGGAALGRPTNVRASKVEGQNQIKIEFTDNATEETIFRISRMRPASSGGTGNYGERVFDVNRNNGTGSVTVYDTVGLICGKSYYYSVQPIRQSGGDSYGEKGYVTTGQAARYDCASGSTTTSTSGTEGMGGGSSTADAPSGLNVMRSVSFSTNNPVLIGTSFLKMTWSGPNANYNIYRCMGVNCTNFSLLAGSTDKLHQDFSTQDNQRYNYKVCLVENASRCSNIDGDTR